MKNEVEQKKRARELDDFSCVCCGTEASEFDVEKLPVHHLNGNKSPNDLDNLVTLCPQCHSWAHSKYEKESKLDEILRKCDRVTDPRLERGFYC